MIATSHSPTDSPCAATTWPASGNPHRRIKWILFVTFPFTVPVPFYMIVVGGLIPTAVIILMTLRGLVAAFTKFTHETLVMLAILAAHVVILGGLLYLVSALLSRILFWLLSRRYSILLASILVGGLIIASCFEIYRLPGHHWTPPANIVGAVGAFAR